MESHTVRAALLRGLLSLLALCSTAAFAQNGKTEVLWLGQAATRITTPTGKVIMIDPWLTSNPKTPANFRTLEALGKDPSLTGRTLIWEALMRKVAERPWTGYGFSAFWGVDSIPAREIRIETQWPVPSAHNGWIDLLVQLGRADDAHSAYEKAKAALSDDAAIGGLQLKLDDLAKGDA